MNPTPADKRGPTKKTKVTKQDQGTRQMQGDGPADEGADKKNRQLPGSGDKTHRRDVGMQEGLSGKPNLPTRRGDDGTSPPNKDDEEEDESESQKGPGGPKMTYGDRPTMTYGDLPPKKRKPKVGD